MRTILSFCCLLFIAAMASAAPISIGGPSQAGWVSLGANYDFQADQQTGDAASDIVGTATDQGFFTTFDNAGTSSLTDGFIGYRIRLDDHGGNNNTIVFDRYLWLGIDADQTGTIDAFIGLNMQGSASEIGLYSPGSGANSSPGTTSMASSPTAPYTYTPNSTNYNYRAVNYLTDGGTTNDIGAGPRQEPDYYVSFMVPFADVAAFLTARMPTKFNANTPFTENTPLRYVFGTSTQPNSLNQDIGGVDGNANSAATWAQLGGFSPTITATGQVVPECSTALLTLTSLLGLVLMRRR